MHDMCGRKRCSAEYSAAKVVGGGVAFGDFRKNRPQEYRALMDKLGSKGKRSSKFSTVQQALVRSTVEGLRREKTIKSAEGYQMFTKKEFIWHWKGRTGMKAKKAKKKWKREIKKKGAVLKHKPDGAIWKCGVEKPEELTAEDSLVAVKQASGPSGSVVNRQNLKVMGTGLGGYNGKKC